MTPYRYYLNSSASWKAARNVSSIYVELGEPSSNEAQEENVNMPQNVVVLVRDDDEENFPD